MPKANQPIFLGNPQKGMAKSPHLGIADIRNCDIHSEPGVVKINEKAQSRTNQVQAPTFTADASTDEITTSAGLSNNSSVSDSTVVGRAVTVSNSGGALPTGLAASTIYYLIPVSTSVYKLATTYANAAASTPIDLTSAGTGTHTITTIEMGRPEEEATDPTTGYSFVVDHNGRVWWNNGSNQLWRLLAGNTLTNGTGNGIAAAFGFLFVFRSTIIDVADVSTQTKIEDPVGQSIWTNGWKTDLTSATKHKTFVKDGIIYFGNARYVGSLEELTTFVPATGATYSYTATELDLEQGWVVGPISELGSKLMVSAARARKSRIFPWNPDETSWDADFPVPGTEVYDIKNILNTLYIASGLTGTIYTSLGTVATLFLELPGHITQLPGSNTASQTKVRRIEHFRNRIFFSVDTLTPTTAEASGVWSVKFDGTGLNLEHQVSSGSYGSVSGVVVPLLHKPSDNVLHIGWQDNDSSLQGLDSIGEGTFALYIDYKAYITFEFLNVGSVKNPWTPGEILFQLTEALASPYGIRLSYRKDTSSSFTTIGTYEFSTLGAVLSHFDEPGILNAEVLQIKAELTGGNQAGPKLRHITIQ